ncbi:MAG: hypothetical protein Ct9H90mP7_2430 [Candidatus Neomarinimicrobiota bacterium]|nr:MAG: hypothetical protein Ct9H90mP7_2430 [Candidatus Neomarinimicrobiota bacterium]
MGYEIAEQLGWRLPDVIVYETGGGTGLIGMWKAFNELKLLGKSIGEIASYGLPPNQPVALPVVKAFQRREKQN